MKQQFTRKLMLLAVMLLAGMGSSFAFVYNGLKYDIIDASAGTVKVTYYGDTEGSGSYSQSSITVPSTFSYGGIDFTVVEIGRMAFAYTSAQSISLPSTIKTIGENAFWNATSLQSIVIPSSVENFSAAVFHGCSSLTSVDFKNKMYQIPSMTFEDCSSLANFTLPDGISLIGDRAFSNTKLTSVVVPETVTGIGWDAYKGCSQLSSVTILGQREFRIESSAFASCDNLRTIISFARMPQAEDGSFTGDPKLFATVYVPESLVDTYKAATGWSGFLNIKAMDNSAVGGHVVDVPGGNVFQDDNYNYQPQGIITINGQSADAMYGQAFVVTPSTDVEVAFVPNSDMAWELETATINGTDVTASLVDGKYTISSISGNQLVQATWKQGTTYSLNTTFSSCEVFVNGSQIWGGSQKYAANKDITVRIKPNSGYGISSFNVNYTDKKGDLVANSDGSYSYTFNLSSDTNIDIYCDQKWNLTTTFNTGGTVTVGGESVTSGTTKELVGSMTSVEISATSGYEIASVLYNGVERLAGNTTMWNFWPDNTQGTNQTLVVTFTVVNPTVSANYDTTMGSVSIAGSQLMPGTTQNYAIGSNVTFTVTPFLGYEIQQVMLYAADGTATDITTAVKTGGNSYTISNIGESYSINVMFGTIPTPADITATIGTQGMATLYSPHALDFSGVAGLKAYIVSAFTPANNRAILTPVNDVPAKTAVVLVGSAGNYTIPTTTTKTYVANLLKGVDSDVKMNTSDGTFTNYILYDGTNGLGFYPIKDNTTLAAGKAYLAIPNTSTSGAPQFVSMDIEGTITGIKNIDADVTGKAVFNLSGQRQSGLKKGINIVGGKKIVVK